MFALSRTNFSYESVFFGPNASTSIQISSSVSTISQMAIKNDYLKLLIKVYLVWLMLSSLGGVHGILCRDSLYELSYRLAGSKST